MYHLHTLKHMSYFLIRWGLSSLTVTRPGVTCGAGTANHPSTKYKGFRNTNSHIHRWVLRGASEGI